MECLSPSHLPDGRTFPCGKCPACVANKASQWYVRLQEELRHSWNAVFCTLTYDEDNLPDVRIDENDCINIDVSKEDIQLYHKRLRKSLGEASKDLKYFLVSEYGPNPTNGWLYRPHYHVIYFNIDKQNYKLIENAWNKGHVEFGEEITEGRIRYLAGYCTEKLFVPIGRLPTFAFISKGIGSSYVDRMRSFHTADVRRMYVPLHGRKLPLPRYWKEKLYSKPQQWVFAETCKERSDKRYQADLARLGSPEAVEGYYYDIRSNFVRKQLSKHKKRKS